VLQQSFLFIVVREDVVTTLVIMLFLLATVTAVTGAAVGRARVSAAGVAVFVVVAVEKRRKSTAIGTAVLAAVASFAAWEEELLSVGLAVSVIAETAVALPAVVLIVTLLLLLDSHVYWK